MIEVILKISDTNRNRRMKVFKNNGRETMQTSQGVGDYKKFIRSSCRNKFKSFLGCQSIQLCKIKLLKLIG